jgi:hypothetical protein
MWPERIVQASGLDSHAPECLHMVELRMLPLSELVAAPYNPRKQLRPTDRAYRKLRQSLESFGLVEPLIWNERTGHIVGGHARLRILQELGHTVVPVSVVHLTLEREQALNVVLNNHEAQGAYDPGKLASLLTQLDGLPEFSLTGFDTTTLSALTMEPVADPVQDSATMVEVSIELTPDQYAACRDTLDTLARTHDVAVHVRGASCVT